MKKLRFTSLLALVMTFSLLGCDERLNNESISPLAGTFDAVEDTYSIELNLRSDGMFTYARVGKNINDRAYGKWGSTDKTVYLNAVNSFPATWGSPSFTLVRDGDDLVAIIDKEEVALKQTANYKDILRNSEDLRKRLYGN